MEDFQFGYGAIGWALAIVNPIVTFFISKWQTKREKKKSDVALISETVTSSVESINKLTDQIGDLVCKLLEEQDKNLTLIKEKAAWMEEREELVSKIDKLQKTVENLNKKIDKLKKGQEHEN